MQTAGIISVPVIVYLLVILALCLFPFAASYFCGSRSLIAETSSVLFAAYVFLSLNVNIGLSKLHNIINATQVCVAARLPLQRAFESYIPILRLMSVLCRIVNIYNSQKMSVLRAAGCNETLTGRADYFRTPSGYRPGRFMSYPINRRIVERTQKDQQHYSKTLAFSIFFINNSENVVSKIVFLYWCKLKPFLVLVNGFLCILNTVQFCSTLLVIIEKYHLYYCFW